MGESSYRFRPKTLALITVLLAGASVISPLGIRGALYPFSIFNTYSYRVLENQSIPFLENLNIGNWVAFLDFKIAFAISVACLIFAAYIGYRRFAVPLFIFIAVFGYLSWTGIRNLPSFALFAVPIIALCFNKIFERTDREHGFLRRNDLKTACLFTIGIIGLVLSVVAVSDRMQNFGIGIAENQMSTAAFIKDNAVRGPIFNNYDIGGYLIFSVSPAEKVFFDNRPEAYSNDFVQNEYIAALENPDVFSKIDEKYMFNAIVYYYRDYTPWGQTFITKKVFDSDWAPVYADAANIILIKRNAENDAIIQKFQLPEDAFRIIK